MHCKDTDQDRFQVSHPFHKSVKWMGHGILNIDQMLKASRGLSHALLAGFASFSLKMIPPASMSSIDIRKYPARELPVSA